LSPRSSGGRPFIHGSINASRSSLEQEPGDALGATFRFGRRNREHGKVAVTIERDAREVVAEVVREPVRIGKSREGRTENGGVLEPVRERVVGAEWRELAGEPRRKTRWKRRLEALAVEAELEGMEQ